MMVRRRRDAVTSLLVWLCAVGCGSSGADAPVTPTADVEGVDLSFDVTSGEPDAAVASPDASPDAITAPDTDAATAGAECGDGVCSGDEDSVACVADCGAECGDGACNGDEGPADCTEDCGAECGDGACTGPEDTATCPADCGADCGDGSCNGDEATTTCPDDCGAACGDGVCNGDEATSTCAADCGDHCGDGVCTGEELTATCPGDCGAECGDGACGPGEDSVTCVADCGAECGDGVCNADEATTTCPEDCGAACGDGVCNGGESTSACAGDCGDHCGDGVCTGEETTATCPADCGTLCGDGVCAGAEDTVTCVADCGSHCGDDVCNAAETSATCPTDCEAASVCGDSVCDPDESCASCVVDCACAPGQVCDAGACVDEPGACGDGSCAPGVEDCGTCPGDCPCPSGTSCSAHQCVADPCEPATCASLGIDCGVASDGCGGTLDCGGCGDPCSLPPLGAPGVALSGGALVDDYGAYLGLGASLFWAAWAYKHDLPKLEANLDFLAQHGFNYFRALGVVGDPDGPDYWDGREIDEQWPDYAEVIAGVTDLAWQKYGLRVQWTLIGDGQVTVPTTAEKYALADTFLAMSQGREHQIVLLETANEYWQNGFGGAAGLQELRELTAYLRAQTDILVAASAPAGHECQDALDIYDGCVADIATIHFDRDIWKVEGSWRPVRQPWEHQFCGLPAGSNNEPIGPGASVAEETDPVKLVSGAVVTWIAGLPMHVYHSSAGVLGFEDLWSMPGATAFSQLHDLLPADLAAWTSVNAHWSNSPFVVYAGDASGTLHADKMWVDVSGPTSGVVRAYGAKSGEDFVVYPMGILGSVTMAPRVGADFAVLDPITGETVACHSLAQDQTFVLSGATAYLLKGRLWCGGAPCGAFDCTTGASPCGDGVCGGGETCSTCVVDCGCPAGSVCQGGTCVGAAPDPNVQWEQYPSNPFVIDLAQPIEEGQIRGSLFAHDADDDGLMDFVITSPGVVAVYGHGGGLLWKVEDGIHLPGAANGGSGYPGIHAPGAIAGDMDGDGAAEVAYVTDDGTLKIRSGASGTHEKSYSFPGAEAVAIANLRGAGDQDAVLQYSQTELRAIDLTNGSTLWHVTSWLGTEHTQVRVTDMDGDGLDEVVGPVFLNEDGAKVNAWNLGADLGTALNGLDSIAIGDIVPGGCLEIALAEQGGNNATIVANRAQVYWSVTQSPGNIGSSGQCKNEKDPDKVAVGDFDPSKPGLEVFARSACGNHPWVHDSSGAIVASWDLPDTAPPGWLHWDGEDEYGVEEIRALDWNGGAKRHLLLKERHVDGKAAIVDAMTGSFLTVFDVQAARVHAADVSGDYREEVLILTSGPGSGHLEVHWNPAGNGQSKPRPWAVQAYRRSQQNWNYYSPGMGSPSLTGGMTGGKPCGSGVGPGPTGCGDGQCAPGEEDCGSCPGDCPCPAGLVCAGAQCVEPGTVICGDGLCAPGEEDCGSCPGDCPCAPGLVCQAGQCTEPGAGGCGDGVCAPGEEDCGSCPGDCPCAGGTTCLGGQCVEPGPECGDGACAPGEEDCGTCPGDCPCPPGQGCYEGACAWVKDCGDGVCVPDFEDCGSCLADCPCPEGEGCVDGGCVSEWCGDGWCAPGEEDCGSCPGDCPCPPGQGCYEGACAWVKDCGDEVCAPGLEDCGSCLEDCPCPSGDSCIEGQCVETGCGDGTCAPGVEDCGSCPGDCPCPPGHVCGAGQCAPSTVCGDAKCGPGVEDCATCPGDCPCPGGTSCQAGQCK